LLDCLQCAFDCEIVAVDPALLYVVDTSILFFEGYLEGHFYIFMTFLSDFLLSVECRSIINVQITVML